MKLVLVIHDCILKRKGLSEFDVKMMIGAALIDKVTSTGKTAEILGIDYRTFIDNLTRYGKPDWDYWKKHYVPDSDSKPDNDCSSKNDTPDSDIGERFEANPKLFLGAGESSSILLAKEKNGLFLSDDLVVRGFADSAGIKIKGTIGVIKDAVKKGLIGIDEAEKSLKTMKQNGCWIPDELLGEEIKRMKNGGELA